MEKQKEEELHILIMEIYMKVIVLEAMPKEKELNIGIKVIDMKEFGEMIK